MGPVYQAAQISEAGTGLYDDSLSPYRKVREPQSVYESESQQEQPEFSATQPLAYGRGGGTPRGRERMVEVTSRSGAEPVQLKVVSYGQIDDPALPHHLKAVGHGCV